MGKLYYSKYDVFVDDTTGVIIDLCTCPPLGDCQFKNAWTNDGSPSHLTITQLDELKIDLESSNQNKQH